MVAIVALSDQVPPPSELIENDMIGARAPRPDATRCPGCPGMASTDGSPSPWLRLSGPGMNGYLGPESYRQTICVRFPDFKSKGFHSGIPYFQIRESSHDAYVCIPCKLKKGRRKRIQN